jgi:hypothetical protein
MLKNSAPARASLLVEIMAESKERRTHRRYPVESVRGSLHFTTDARVINLSLDGMSIETPNPLKVGREYSLKLDEPGHLLPMRGVVVWCSLVKTTRSPRGDVEPVYRAGIHFAQVLSGKAKQLEGFIRRNTVISLESRVFGRFRIEAEKSADLVLEADFRVLQISLSGMLLESDAAPPSGAQCQMEVQLGEVEFSTLAQIARVEQIESPEGEEVSESPVVHLGLRTTADSRVE